MLVVFAWVPWEGVARADDVAAAEAIFLEAKAIADGGNWAAACPKFQASYELDRTFGTLLNVANCNEQIGKLATAWAAFGEAEAWAKRDGDEREAYARGRRTALEPRLSRLTLSVTRPAEGITVRRGAEVVAPAAYGQAIPVDSGVVVVTVRRGDQELLRQEVTTVEGADVDLPLDLTAIAGAVPPPKPPAPPAPPVPDTPPPEPFWNGQRTVGFIVGLVGVAGVASFGVLEGIAISKKAEADEPGSCFDGICTPEGAETASDAERFAEVGQWVGIGGVVALGVGATLFLTAGGGDPPPASATTPASAVLVPAIGPDGGGLWLRGTL